MPPVDHLADLRDEICLELAEVGLNVERSHHEVGTAGAARDQLPFNTLLHAGDDMMKYKYIVKNIARPHGKTATFMPKPLFGDNGSGMHTHQSLWKDGKPLFSDERGYAGLTRHGALVHRWPAQARPARSRVREPDDQQLPPAGPGLRGAGQPGLLGAQPLGVVRIPIYRCSPKAKRLEFRSPTRRATRTSRSRRC